MLGGESLRALPECRGHRPGDQVQEGVLWELIPVSAAGVLGELISVTTASGAGGHVAEGQVGKGRRRGRAGELARTLYHGTPRVAFWPLFGRCELIPASCTFIPGAFCSESSRRVQYDRLRSILELCACSSCSTMSSQRVPVGAPGVNKYVHTYYMWYI